MRLPATKFIVFNAAAGLVGVAALVTAVKTVLLPDPIAPCIERYHSMTGFALERAGATLTAADLQASLGGKDVGVIDNITIGPVKDAPAPLAISVVVGKATASPQASAESKGGATFPWEPRVLQGKTSACLSYQVLLPANFDFQRGGALPGIGGADAGEQGDKFLARLAWRPKAIGGATVRVTENGATRTLPAERTGFEFPRGKWVKLEQEVVLNTPKKSDGVLRVWVDGTLAIDRTDMTYRAKPDVTISGVSVDVFYGSGPDEVQPPAAKDAKVWLTPFEVRWQ
jgi:polysaccharide lyase-like protein